jgi:hypothetical protein
MATVFIQTCHNISCIKRVCFVFFLRESSEGDEGSQFRQGVWEEKFISEMVSYKITLKA